MGKSSIFSNCLSFTRSINFSSKKAISPIVATALLLVVAVVAVVGFQTWFGTYSSGLFSKAETTSNYAMGGSLKIETLVGNNLYINNKIAEGLNVTSLKIGGKICNLSNLTLGMNTIDVSNCTSNLTTSTPEIVLITGKQVVSKKVYVNGVTSTSSSSISTPSLDCSTLNGDSWIKVSGNSALGTSDFCVMKYEAKCTEQTNGQNCIAGNTLISQAANTPWVNINQTDARTTCANLGAGYHLITNAEWVTVARLAENNPSNWNSSVVGSGFIYSGHNDNSPANALNATINDSDGYYRTGNIIGSNQRRTLNISGSMIWDLAGNVWEWNNDTITGNTGGNLGQSSLAWYKWTAISGHDNLEPLNSTFNSVNGVGNVYTGGESGTTVYGFLHGGWYYGAYTGAFALYLDYAPSVSGAGIGFRCSYSQ